MFLGRTFSVCANVKQISMHVETNFTSVYERTEWYIYTVKNVLTFFRYPTLYMLVILVLSHLPNLPQNLSRIGPRNKIQKP